MAKVAKKYLLNRFGFGLSLLSKFYFFYGFNIRLKNTRIKKEQTRRIFKVSQKTRLLGRHLKTKIKEIIQFYVSLKNIRGLRHKFGNPVRGQRTRTNAKTNKRISRKLV